MENFENYKKELHYAADNMDTESAHCEADGILCQIALNTELTKEQRRELVDIYLSIGKWYA